jgi:hypothetical protein
MADIVDRLMDATDRDANSDAIEEVVALRKEIKRLRAALEAIADPRSLYSLAKDRARAALAQENSNG